MHHILLDRKIEEYSSEHYAASTSSTEAFQFGSAAQIAMVHQYQHSTPTVMKEDNPDSPVRIYHERQSKQLCALHTLNNLFQNQETFKKQDLDAICKELAPDSIITNPHRSTFGLGCYDVNVIISALSKRGFDVIWFDKRKDLSRLNLSNIFGFILNVPNTLSGLFTTPLNYLPIQAQFWSSQKHWVALRKIGNYYYDLDSKLIAPCCIGDEEAVLQYLAQKSSIEQVEILIVVPKCESESQSWMKRAQ